MKNPRTMPATEADTKLGEILATIDELGPCVITNNGRDVAVISPAPQGDKSATLPQIARRFAAGEMSWPDIRDAHAVAFGDLLEELGRQELSLPIQRGAEHLALARERFVRLIGSA